MICATALVPVAFLIVNSIAINWFWPALWPREYGWRSWLYVASPAAGVSAALGASLLIAGVVTTLSLVVAVPAGRVLAQSHVRAKSLLSLVLLAPILAPTLAATMGVHLLFLYYGLTDSLLGVILAHLIPTVPYATLMLAGAFANYDADYEAQARTLGASPVAVWSRVTLPLIAPGLLVAGAFAFLLSWSQYLTTLLIGGGQIVTLPLLLVAFQRGGDEGVTAALSLIFLGPTLIVFLVVTKFLKHHD